MTPTHSPGPWKVLAAPMHPHFVIYDKEGEPVASIITDHIRETRGNAHLVAAAPALFDFAIQVLSSLADECAPHHAAAPYTNEQLADQARAVIALVEPDLAGTMPARIKWPI